jgi:hypothetical protein
VATSDDETPAGTQPDGMMTALVDGIVITKADGIYDGTFELAITTGECGKFETTTYDEVGPDGIELGVTNGTVKTTDNDGVGTDATDELGKPVAYEAGIITPVVSGIITTDEAGTSTGNEVAGTITGLDGNEV